MADRSVTPGRPVPNLPAPRTTPASALAPSLPAKGECDRLGSSGFRKWTWPVGDEYRSRERDSAIWAFGVLECSGNFGAPFPDCDVVVGVKGLEPRFASSAQ